MCPIFLDRWEDTGQPSPDYRPQESKLRPWWTLLSKDLPFPGLSPLTCTKELKVEPAFRAGSSGNSGMSLL